MYKMHFFKIKLRWMLVYAHSDGRRILKYFESLMLHKLDMSHHFTLRQQLMYAEVSKQIDTLHWNVKLHGDNNLEHKLNKKKMYICKNRVPVILTSFYQGYTISKYCWNVMAS